LLKLNLSEDELGELAFQMAYALTHWKRRENINDIKEKLHTKCIRWSNRRI
jgi:hypothetical protein